MIEKHQAILIADRWLNPGGGQHGPRRIGAHEFPLGWVVWAVPPPPERDPVTGGRRPPAEVGGSCGVVDRRTGELTVWPSLPAEEVARVYTDKHGGGGPGGEEKPGVTGPGNTIAVSYTDPRKGESYVNRVSAPGMPPVEWSAYYDLHRLAVPPEAVTGVHTDLRPSLLPGGYTLDFLKRTFPNADLSCAHDYGSDPEDRARGVAELRRNVETMHRIAGRQPPPAPHRVPVPADVQPAPRPADRDLGRQLEGVFGPGEVLRHPGVGAHPLLPQSTRATLVETGVPKAVPLFFAADDPQRPPRGGMFADAATHLRAHGTEAGEDVLKVLADHVRIGTDGLHVITVQCKGSEQGAVWSANPETGGGRYVNDSVASYARSLGLLHVARSQMVGMDPVGAGAVLTGFQRQLAGIDRSALAKQRNWWAVVVEQMWHGLF